MATLEIKCRGCKMTIRETVEVGKYTTAGVLKKYNWSRGVLLNGYLCQECSQKNSENKN